jgi:hypothetical protein
MTGRKWLATGIALAASAAAVAGIRWATRAGEAQDERRAHLAERARLAASAAGNAGPEAEIAALREALAAEREARAALEVLVEELRADAGEPGAAPDAGEEPPEPAAFGAAGAGEAQAGGLSLPGTLAAAAPGDELAPAGAAEPHGSHQFPTFFDDARLEGLGLLPGEVVRLRERFEEAEMQALYLQDRAAREGWLQKPRFQIARMRQQRELREEVGDESYDQMLWAAGRPNRVKLLHVLHSSPADGAGLQAGDHLLSYDGERVFTPFDLQRGTRTARAGSQVPVEVLREGEGVIRVFLPAGPMGAQLGPATLPPRGPGG